MSSTPLYPKFYRNSGHCLKRESDVKAVEVRIPDPGQSLPLVHQPVFYASKNLLDNQVNGMTPVNQEVYESFLSTFFKAAAENAKQFLAYKQRRYEKNLASKSQLNLK